MPRQARLDAPGLLQHIMARGNDKREIFLDSKDYEEFLKRLGRGVSQIKTQCLAWALMPNHFHLLVRSGPAGIAPLMRSLMTGYAMYFNRKYKRVGHLFQNRYKSIVCEEDPYFLQLVRYIHLNPLRAGLVSTLKELEAYPWTGHGVIMGSQKREWQDSKSLLSEFGEIIGQARRQYLQYLEAEVPLKDDSGLVGGKFLGSFEEIRKQGYSTIEKWVHDERMLGSGNFMDEIFRQTEKREDLRRDYKRKQINLDELTKSIAGKYQVPCHLLTTKGKQKNIVYAKAQLIALGVDCLGKTIKEMAQWVKITESAASKARTRILRTRQEGALVGTTIPVPN